MIEGPGKDQDQRIVPYDRATAAIQSDEDSPQDRAVQMARFAATDVATHLSSFLVSGPAVIAPGQGGRLEATIHQWLGQAIAIVASLQDQSTDSIA